MHRGGWRAPLLCCPGFVSGGLPLLEACLRIKITIAHTTSVVESKLNYQAVCYPAWAPFHVSPREKPARPRNGEGTRKGGFGEVAREIATSHIRQKCAIEQMALQGSAR